MVIFASFFGLYFFPHQSCTSSTLLLRKSITNLYHLFFNSHVICLSSARWCSTADVANPRPREVGGACGRLVLAGARTRETVGGPNGAQRSEFRRTVPHDNDDAVTDQCFTAMPHISVVGQAYMALTMFQGYLTCQRKPYIWWSGHTNMPQAHLPGHFAWLPFEFSNIRPRRIPAGGTTPRPPL